MPQGYTFEPKNKIIDLKKKKERKCKGIVSGRGVSKVSASKYRGCSELHKDYKKNPEIKMEYSPMEEIQKLKKENCILRKENIFLKKIVVVLAEVFEGFCEFTLRV